MSSFGFSRTAALLVPPAFAFLLSVACIRAAADDNAAEPRTIRRVDLVHMTHTDIGYTDHPLVCREQQVRYLDIAIDAVLATSEAPPEGRFYWTAETTLAVDDWWQAAAAPRREKLLEAIGTGRLEIAAVAMNQTPTLSAVQWQKMLHWLPVEVHERARPRVAIQNDVNGFPRAGAIALLDEGVEYLFMGINATMGGQPLKQPAAFWWKMPDGRRIFVWLGDHYAQGFYYFHPHSWRRCSTTSGSPTLWPTATEPSSSSSTWPGSRPRDRRAMRAPTPQRCFRSRGW